MAKKLITIEQLKKNGFYTSIVGEYHNGIFAIESDDKKIEIDIDFWINIKNPEDIQLRIHRIDKTVKAKHVSKTMLDVPITSVKQVKLFLNAFNIENIFKF